MPVTLSSTPTSTFSRYILVFEDAPTVATFGGAIEHLEDAGLLSILVLASDGSTEPVLIEQEDDGTWIAIQSSAEGRVIEEILYDTGEPGGSVVQHKSYVEGFTTDEVPAFTAAA